MRQTVKLQLIAQAIYSFTSIYEINLYVYCANSQAMLSQHTLQTRA